MKTLKEEDKPSTSDKPVDKKIMDTVVGGLYSSLQNQDTRKKVQNLLKNPKSTKEELSKALNSPHPPGSQSTTTGQSAKGTTGTIPTGSKSISDNNDSNQTNSNISETIYNKGKNMRKKINVNEEAPALSSAGQKLETRLDKIPNLDELLAGVKGKGNGAQVLLQIAEGLGGEKEPALVLLQAAVALAQKEKSKPKTDTPPGAPPGAPPSKALKEFVSYLFEGTER